MKRPGFTVELKDGRNYDANHITYAWDHGWVITFISSGVLETMFPEQIKEIRFVASGPEFCGECDGPVPTRG